MLVEQTAEAERDAHCFEVAWGDGISKAGVITVGTVVILELYAISVQVPAERQLAGERRRLNAGNAADGFEGLSEEPVSGTVVVKSAAGRLHLHRKYVGRIESRSDREQMIETAQKQSRTNQHYQSERNLRNDKRTTRPLVAPRGALRAFLQSNLWFIARRA